MKILILTVGTRGDIQPYVVIGQGLQAKGHQVMVCAPEKFKSFILEQGLAYGFMPNDILDLLDTQAGKDAMENTRGIFGAVRTSLKLIKRVKPIQKGIMQACYESALSFKPEALLFHVKTLCGVHIAEKLNIPVVMTLPLPAIVPTSERPCLGLPDLDRLPKALAGKYNRLTYTLAHLGLKAYRKLIQDFRENVVGLEAQPKSISYFQKSDGSQIPFLHPFSPLVVSEPKDWPSSAAATGYVFLDQPDWQMPEDLARFIAAGDKPIYIGFGSIGGKTPEKTAAVVLEAIEKAEVRAVIATGWGGLKITSQKLTANVFVIEKAPHDQLFPHMAGVIHHGGAGSTAAGLRAGKPTLVCPFFGDQPFWGQQVNVLGVGPEPIPQKELSVRRLVPALRLLRHSKAMQTRAHTLGLALQKEEGLAHAVDFLEKHFYA